MSASQKLLVDRVPVTPQFYQDDESETKRVIARAYAPVRNRAFEPWNGLQALGPFGEWIPADGLPKQTGPLVSITSLNLL